MKFIKNILSDFNLKHFFIVLFLFIIYFIFSAFSYTNAVCNDIANSVFRLHVIANSNSAEDQNLKYIVRDSVIDYINEISNGSTSKENVIKIAQNHIEEIKNIAKQTIINNGYAYDVSVSIGNFAFPTKEYGDIILPPGYYDALKIEIGEAKGENWWCVMFPPLCFVDVTSGIVLEDSKQIMRDALSDEEYSLISESSSEIEFKFKIVEVLQNFTISGIFM